MPDIAMCSGGECPRKNSCYRFTANPWQVAQNYFIEPPLDPNDMTCDYFLPNKKSKEPIED